MGAQKYNICCVFSCTSAQLKTSILTFMSYAFLHVTRISFSRVKSCLQDEIWLDSSLYDRSEDQTSMLGLLDTIFLCLYAIGLYASGVIGDRVDLRVILTVCMVLSGFMTIGFGAGGFFGIHSLGFFAAVWGFNGLVQSLGWPANVSVMGNWFGPKERGAVVGLWSGNASFGNILGTGLCAIFLGYGSGSWRWQGAMVIAGSLSALHGAVLWFCLAPSPDTSAGEDCADEAASDAMDQSYMVMPEEGDTADPVTQVGGREKAVTFWRAWLIPGVAQYALCYAALKSVNYGLFFWAPFYLKNHFSIAGERADLISMLYDVGQIAGGTVAGKATDTMGVRAPATAVMLLCSSALLYAFRSADLEVMYVLLFVTGFMMGGPANLVSGCISADLGMHSSLRGNSKALATVTGIIDGTGSIGAAIIQFTIGGMAKCTTTTDHDLHRDTICTGWNNVFLMLIIGNILASFCIANLAVSDFKKWWANRSA